MSARESRQGVDDPPNPRQSDIAYEPISPLSYRTGGMASKNAREQDKGETFPKSAAKPTVRLSVLADNYTRAILTWHGARWQKVP